MSAPLKWPNDHAGQVALERQQELAATIGHAYAEAWTLALYVREWEVSDGRGGEPAFLAADALCAALENLAGMDE